MKEFKDIPEINWESVETLFEGKTGNFLKVLRSYTVNTKTKLTLIQSIDKENLKLYETTVHGIKGSSRGIGALEIGEKAYELEKAAETGNIDFLNKNNILFIEEVKLFIARLEEAFKNIDSKTIKPKKDKPDDAVLKKLMEACDIYDMSEVEDAIKELTAYQYEQDNDLVDFLKRCAEEMNYDAITEKLREYF